MIFFFLLLTLLLHFARSRRDRNSTELPSKLPSPPFKLPVIGHMHLIGSQLPHVSLRDLAAKHGPDVMLIHLGAVPTLVVSSPRAAKAVLRTHDLAFASRPRSMLTDIIMYGASDSCFAPYGDHFRKARKAVTVHLLSSKKVQSYRPVREEEVRLVLAKLRHHAAAPVDMSQLLQSFANDLICRTISGKFFCEEGRNEVFRDLVAANNALLGGFNLEAYFPGLARMRLISKLVGGRAMRVRRRWDQLLDNLIDDHLAIRLARTHDDDQHDTDFIDVLLSRQEEYGFHRDTIKALLIDMFEAGTDTTHLVLEYAMVELIRKPHVLAKLQDEVRSITPKGQDAVTEDDIVDMVYLKAVIKETLRLHPPGGLTIPHLAREDCAIVDGSYMIPAGTCVIINLWALNRHADYWDMPDEFMPGRFMDGINKGTNFQGQYFHFLPFGSGRRMCTGIHSATITLQIMLANLMYCFNWKLPSGMKEEDVDTTDVFGLAIHRKEKLFLVPQVA
ncbi:indole-2-monooxygenase-like [Oryza brachyantha]|uniref:indole-2-monooxygenase-like n=1 Tax=Oryza brachyantha TaxID=4533 RepID=UPI001ADD1798|nr:indole-2-monooxygenase-like [Oryza brachyantha]